MTWEIEDSVNTGEKVLWASVLRRSVFDYVQYKGNVKFDLKWKRAYRFLFCDESVNELDPLPTDSEEGDAYGAATFEEVCAMFGWDPEYIRRVVKKLNKSDVKSLEPSRFKEEYYRYYNDSETITEKSKRVWKSAGLPVMLYSWLLYGRDYRSSFIPKSVVTAQTVKMLPVVSWVRP